MKNIKFNGEYLFCRELKDYAEKNVSDDKFSFEPFQNNALNIYSPQGNHIDFEKSLFMFDEHGTLHCGLERFLVTWQISRVHSG